MKYLTTKWAEEIDKLAYCQSEALYEKVDWIEKQVELATNQTQKAAEHLTSAVDFDLFTGAKIENAQFKDEQIILFFKAGNLVINNCETLKQDIIMLSGKILKAVELQYLKNKKYSINFLLQQDNCYLQQEILCSGVQTNLIDLE